MYYDKDGNEINPALIPMPRLCADCDKKDDIEEEILCTLTRLDQRDKNEFVCYAYISRYGVLNDEIIEIKENYPKINTETKTDFRR